MVSVSLYTAHSFYRSNISADMLASQRAVFDHLGIPLEQHLDDSLTHAKWAERMLSGEGAEVVVLVDIDAFPLRRDAYEELCSKAQDGALVGLAQVANHKDPTRLYAGPMFLALRRDLYRDFGSPELERGDRVDVAQVLTDRAEEHGVQVELIYPSCVIQPRWALHDKGVFGIGTFYGEMEFFHLFESRKRKANQLFQAVARDCCLGRFDFQNYLSIMQERRKFLGLF